jgi:hypothetical protein
LPEPDGPVMSSNSPVRTSKLVGCKAVISVSPLLNFFGAFYTHTIILLIRIRIIVRLI